MIIVSDACQTFFASEEATAQEVQDYMRQNSQFTHDVIVASNR
jgi:hypothetical protein